MHYKDYAGIVEILEEDAVFHGKIVEIKALISFEGDSINTITEDFKNAVDEYFDYFAQSGNQPEKPSRVGQYGKNIKVTINIIVSISTSELALRC